MESGVPMQPLQTQGQPYSDQFQQASYTAPLPFGVQPYHSGQPYVASQPFADQGYGSQLQQGLPPASVPGGQPFYSEPDYGMQPQHGQPPMGQQPFGQQLLSPEEQTKELKRQEKQASRERKAAREQEGGASTVTMLCSLSLVNAIMLLIATFGSEWTTKQFVGFGVKALNIRTSLFTLDFHVVCGKNRLEDLICKKLEGFKGVHTLHDARITACMLEGEICDVFSNMYRTSFIILITYALSLFCLVVGAVFLYTYWHCNPLPQVRRIALGLLLAASLFSGGGLGAWSIFVPDLAEVPRALSSTALGDIGSAHGSSGVFTLTETSTWCFGWCWGFSLVAVSSILVQAFLWPICFVPHKDEEEALLAEENRQMGLDPAMTAFEEVQPLLAGPPAPTHYGIAASPGPPMAPPQAARGVADGAVWAPSPGLP